MKILPSWLRTMVSGALPADDQLADELTLIGIAVEGTGRTGAEAVFEMEITTNRVDAMNHYGIARECSALYDLELRPIAPKVPEGASEGFPIEIREASLCARYTSLILRDVNVKPSAGQVAERFAALGQKAINNAADASNYALLELGHPTHVFDLDRLVGCKLIVRKALKGEKLKTLDGVERALFENDLVIADAERPVAIAGVLGGEETKVTEATRNILIESAWFDTATVRRTSKRHILHTDASHRFERGADFNATPLACRRVAELIVQQGGGRIASPLLDNIARQITIAPVELRLAQVRRILGKEIDEAEIERILGRLGFALRPLSAGHFETAVPTWRLDVSREIDLIEEVARVHGFNRFENHLPPFSGGVVELPASEGENHIRQTLLALGYNEALSYTFSSREDVKRFTPGLKPVALENPLSEERAVMRTSLIPGMLDMLEHNLNRDQNTVRLFEIGNVFHADGEQVAQAPAVCFAFTMGQNVSDWPEGGFYQLKGDLENLLRRLDGIFQYATDAPEFFHPGRSACVSLNGTVVATLGEIAASSYGLRKFKQSLYLCEIYLDRLYAQPVRKAGYEPLSRFPAVERDLSFLLPNAVTWEELRAAVTGLNIPELRDFRIVEVFRGKSIGEDRYSALFRVVLQSVERTLKDNEVALWSERLIAAITALGGSQRTG